MVETAVDRLLKKIDEKQSPCVVGLDPVVERLPEHLLGGNSFQDVAKAFRAFNYAIIDEVAHLVPAVKPQLAFYEKYGSEGLLAFKDTVNYARSKGLLVIADGKRNDIASTAKAYADGYLGHASTKSSSKPSLDVDFLTINPFLGSDGLDPFISACKEYGKGIFILVKTSNPSSGEIQDRLVEATSQEIASLHSLGIEHSGHSAPLYEILGLKINALSQNSLGNRGYSSIGAVVGATYPEQAKNLRKILAKSLFLVPGFGSQGACAKDLVPCFNDDGYGAIVNSSRGVIFAYEKDNDPERFAVAARESTIAMIDEIKSALANCGKLPTNWNSEPY